MLQPKNDPFFEELKAEIQEATESADRGETLSMDEVRKSLEENIQRVARGEMEPRMYQPKGDPFFPELKAEIEAGLEEADRGELIDHDAVWASVAETIKRVACEGGSPATAVR